MMTKALLYFTNENISLVNLQNLENQSLRWLMIDNSTLKPLELELIAQESQMINDNLIEVRKFKDSELRFDGQFAKFQHQNNGHILLQCDHNKTPKELLTL